MQITKSGYAYLARQYEQAADANLDVDALRLHLARKGILGGFKNQVQHWVN